MFRDAVSAHFLRLQQTLWQMRCMPPVWSTIPSPSASSTTAYSVGSLKRPTLVRKSRWQLSRSTTSRNRLSVSTSPLPVNSSRSARSHSLLAGKSTILVRSDEGELRSCLYHSLVGVVLLNWIDPALMLSFYSIACCTFALGTAYGPGKAGVGCLFALFFFESICYPVCCVLRTIDRCHVTHLRILKRALGDLHPRDKEFGQTYQA